MAAVESIGTSSEVKEQCENIKSLLGHFLLEKEPVLRKNKNEVRKKNGGKKYGKRNCLGSAEEGRFKRP